MEHICTLCNHYSRTTEQNERHEQTDAHVIAALRARIAELEAGLRNIVNGNYDNAHEISYARRYASTVLKKVQS